VFKNDAKLKWHDMKWHKVNIQTCAVDVLSLHTFSHGYKKASWETFTIDICV